MSLYSTEKKIVIVPGCIVCKTCEFLAPDLFVVKEKALDVDVLNPEPGPQQIPELTEAIRACPVHVIHYKKHRPPVHER